MNPGPFWLDGEQAGRPFPVPRYTSEVIVDDQSPSPQFTKGCAAGSPCWDWYQSSYGYQNHMFYTYVSDVEDYWAEWRPTIPESGYYEVYVYVPDHYATSWQTSYTIHSQGGQRTVKVDQEGLRASHPNQWTSLGVYRFEAGGYVRVVDATGEAASTNRKIAVDAIKLRRRAPTYLADVRGDTAGWTSILRVRNNGPRRLSFSIT